jgi:hypothetical protein
MVRLPLVLPPPHGPLHLGTRKEGRAQARQFFRRMHSRLRLEVANVGCTAGEQDTLAARYCQWMPIELQGMCQRWRDRRGL